MIYGKMVMEIRRLASFNLWLLEKRLHLLDWFNSQCLIYSHR